MPEIVLANGCFDLLHPGHVEHLEEARSFGDLLTVALTIDEFVGKKGRPVMSWEERAVMLRALRCVSSVVPCKNGAEAIRQWRPDVFAKGSDYENIGLLEAELQACKEVGTAVRFTKAPKQSTTDLIERIRCASL
jgi:rfaE bifunctional protein nucleotidyltransferase chain/domain